MGRFISSRRYGKPRVCTKREPTLSGNTLLLARRAEEMEEERLAHTKLRTTRANYRRRYKLSRIHNDFMDLRQYRNALTAFKYQQNEYAALSLMVSLWEKGENHEV